MARNTDWAQPGTGTLYTTVLTDLKDLAFMGSTMLHTDDDAIIGPEMDSAATEGSIKWSVNNNRFEKRVGSTWSPLTANYNINVTTFNGHDEASYRDISQMTGVLHTDRFTATTHGIINKGDAHQLATTAIDGFMSKVQVQELVDAKAGSRTDAEIATAYDSQRQVITSGDLTDATTRRITGAAIANFIEEKLKAAITAVTFKQLYSSGTTLIDVKRGQYQELIVSANTAITFKEYSNNPFTMYLYITSNGNTVTVPKGPKHRWSGGAQPADINSSSPGIDLLTVNYDGKGNFYYMLLADMREDTT